MNYENGFYIYMPTEEANGNWYDLDVPQIIKILSNNVYIFNSKKSIDVEYVASIGVIGEMVMSQDGWIK